MSAWRRLAIEHIPSCKKIIEEAEDPGAMWIRLAGELGGFQYVRHAPMRYEIDETKAHEIHRFAFECLRGKVNPVLSRYAFYFYSELFDLPRDEILKDIPHHYATGELNHLKKCFPYSFPSKIMHF
jgi:hypothetical protein